MRAWLRAFTSTAVNTYLVVGVSALLVWALDAAAPVDLVSVRITAIGAALAAVITALGTTLLIWSKLRTLIHHVNHMKDELERAAYERGVKEAALKAAGKAADDAALKGMIDEAIGRALVKQAIVVTAPVPVAAPAPPPTP